MILSNGLLIGICFKFYYILNFKYFNDLIKFLKLNLINRVVFSLFNNLESIFGLLLQSIPMYFFFKIIFLLVLFLPQYNGATYIYEKLLKDLFIRYESAIYDTFINITKNINFPNTEELKKNLQNKVVEKLIENKK